MRTLIPRSTVILFFTALLLPWSSRAEAQAGAMRQWQLAAGPGGEGCQLSLIEVPIPRPGPGEIQVRIHATSLNGHDSVGGECGSAGPGGQVPLADGAGEVIAVGPGVSRFQMGDRVAGAFFAEFYLDSPRPDDALSHIRGGPGPGMLSEFVVGNEEGFVEVPDHLSYEEAATLPTAAVTAWAGLFKHGQLKPNEHVLLEGTGGVSSFGLLFAVAAGAKPIVTSSSDAKLARAQELGAVGTVNYRTQPEWQEEVLRLTNGRGVQQVLEVGGAETRERAFQTLAMGGHIALVGGLTGYGGSIPARDILARDARVTSFWVGSRADFEAMNRFIAGHQIRPIIDRVFDFEEAPQAFDFLENGDYMGKIVIRL